MGASRYARPTVARAMISWRSQVGRPSKSGEMTAMSMSLDSLAVPLAKEPYRMTASRRIRACTRRTKSSSFWSSSAWLVTTRRTSSSHGEAPAPFLHYTLRRDSGSLPHGPRAALETSFVPPLVQYRQGRLAPRGHESWALPVPAPPLQPSRASQRPVGRSTPRPARARLRRDWQRRGCHGPLSSATLRCLLAWPDLIPSPVRGSNA